MKLFILLLACFSGIKSSEVDVSKSDIEELIVDYLNQKTKDSNLNIELWSSMSYNDGDVIINYDLTDIEHHRNNLKKIKLSTTLNRNDISGFIQVFRSANITGDVSYEGKIKGKSVEDSMGFSVGWSEIRQDISFNANHDGGPVQLIDLQVNTTFSDPKITIYGDEPILNKILTKTFENLADSFDGNYRKSVAARKETFNRDFNHEGGLRYCYDYFRAFIPRRMFNQLVLF